MHLKGSDKLREKLPDYPGRKIGIFGLLAILSFAGGLLLMEFIDVLPRILPDYDILYMMEPILPILGTALMELIGFRIVFSLWYKKDKMIAESRETAYQRVFHRAAIGIPLVFAVAVRTYVPIEALGVPVNGLTSQLSSSMLLQFVSSPEIDLILRTIGSIVLLLLALLTIRRSLLSFGIDYMAVVYVYYPEESEIQDNEIYSVVRHPAYFGGVLLCLGGVLSTLSLYSFVFFLMFVIGFLYHIYRVEERELIERFGESFIEYKSKVSGLYVRPHDLGTFFRFLVGRRKPETPDTA